MNDHPNRNQNQKATDEDLAAIVRGDAVPAPATVKDICEELLRLRRCARGDSRRADQIRRLRWQAETLTVKAEELTRRVVELGGEAETLDDVAGGSSYAIKDPAA